MDKTILATTAGAFAALDFTADNARIAELQADIARYDAAIDAAQARCEEISQRIRELTGPDAIAVAEALLAERPAREAAAAGPSEVDMRAERESLVAGMKELRDRIRAAWDEVKEVRRLAHNRAAQAAKPLVDALVADMQTAAEQLIEGFAALSAINLATEGHAFELGRAREVVGALAGQGKLLDWRRHAPVPDDVKAALAALEGKGAALLFRQMQQATLP